MALVKFNIESTSQKVTTEVKAGAHTFFVDEPKNLVEMIRVQIH